MHTFRAQKGFTIFFATLVASLALAVGVAVYDLTVRELDLSITATQSQYAIYAADAGSECALFLDLQFSRVVPADTDSSAFATSSQSSAGIATAGQAFCNSQDIVAGGLLSGWSVSALDTTHATTSFYVSLGASRADPCAFVTVAKYGTPSKTTVTSHGYNSCNVTGGVVKLERTLQLNY